MAHRVVEQFEVGVVATRRNQRNPVMLDAYQFGPGPVGGEYLGLEQAVQLGQKAKVELRLVESG